MGCRQVEPRKKTRGRRRNLTYAPYLAPRESESDHGENRRPGDCRAVLAEMENRARQSRLLYAIDQVASRLTDDHGQKDLGILPGKQQITVGVVVKADPSQASRRERQRRHIAQARIGGDRMKHLLRSAHQDILQVSCTSGQLNIAQPVPAKGINR